MPIILLIDRQLDHVTSHHIERHDVPRQTHIKERQRKALFCEQR